jgi:hypothetical protein
MVKCHVGSDGMLTLIVETSEQSSFDQEALQWPGMPRRLPAWNRQTCRTVSSTAWPLACRPVAHLPSVRDCKPRHYSRLGELIRRLGNRTRCSDRLESTG